VVLLLVCLVALVFGLVVVGGTVVFPDFKEISKEGRLLGTAVVSGAGGIVFEVMAFPEDEGGLAGVLSFVVGISAGDVSFVMAGTGIDPVMAQPPMARIRATAAKRERMTAMAMMRASCRLNLNFLTIKYLSFPG
jgi:hypothetical protein